MNPQFQKNPASRLLPGRPPELPIVKKKSRNVRVPSSVNKDGFLYRQVQYKNRSERPPTHVQEDTRNEETPNTERKVMISVRDINAPFLQS